ncbi:MAG: YpdA family putative bacillithiol disulfide reductase, partial [Bacteroidota bacterium]
IYDVIIIGAGPCGLACAIEAQKNKLNYLILEKGSIAESIRRYPLEMTFFSTAENIEIGGLPLAVTGAKATRAEALQYYRRVAEYYQLKVQLHTNVLKVEKQEDIFQIQTSRRETYLTRNVVLATGYFDCPRMLNIPGEASPHVFKYYDEPYRYIHSKVAIIGGGNSAVSTALDLYRHGVEVTMIVRKEDFKPTAKYWLVPDLKNRIKAGKIKARFNTQVTRIEHGRVWMKEKDQEEEQILPADFVFMLIGYTPDVNLLRSIGVEVDPKHLAPLFNPETFESNIKGLYLAGTVVSGVRTEKVFIENGRYDGRKIVKNILESKKQMA